MASKVTDLIPKSDAAAKVAEPTEATDGDSEGRGVYRVTCPKRSDVTLVADSRAHALELYHATREQLADGVEASAERVGE